LVAQDAWVRVFAARALAKLADPAAVPALARALDDPEPDARDAAVLALALLAHPSDASATTGSMLGAAVPPLAAILRGGPPRAAGLAADALTRIGRPALGPLVTLLSDARTAPQAARALAGLALPEAAEALARAGVEPYRPGPPDFLLPASALALDDGAVAAFEARLSAGGRVDDLPHPKADFLRHSYSDHRRGSPRAAG
jgi:HEAT repeat protein